MESSDTIIEENEEYHVAEDETVTGPESPRRRHWLIVAAAAIVLAAILGVYYLWNRAKPAQAATQPVEVEVVQVEQKDVPVYSEWIGTTDGMVNADIKAEVPGYLLHQDYKEGSYVEKGQLLFELDPRPFQAAVDQANGQIAQYTGQLEQANAQIAQAQAQEAQANAQIAQANAQVASAEANQTKTQLDVNKYKPLVEQKAVTQQEFDNAVQTNVAARAQVDAAKAGVETAKAQLRAAQAQIRTATAATNTAKGQIKNAEAALKTAQLNLSFTRITSPIDGVAGVAAAQVGNLIQTTSSPLTTVSTVNPIKVYFSLNEREYLAFTKRDIINGHSGATQSIQLTLILSDGTEYPHKGTFYLADRQVDPKTGAIKLAAIFENPGNVLRPGQYGRVRAVTSETKDALLVPQRAVQELQGNYSVAVVGADNKIEMRPVKVGDRVDSSWVITDGLKAGETIVVEGLQKIKAGVQVTPKPFAAKDAQ